MQLDSMCHFPTEVCLKAAKACAAEEYAQQGNF